MNFEKPLTPFGLVDSLSVERTTYDELEHRDRSALRRFRGLRQDARIAVARRALAEIGSGR